MCDVGKFEGITRNADTIRAVLNARGTRSIVSDGGHGPEVRICCPYCVKRSDKKTPDTKYRMWLNGALDRYVCYRCNAKGTVSGLLPAVQGKLRVLPNAASIAQKPLVEVEFPGDLTRPHDLSPEHPANKYLLKGRKHRSFDPRLLNETFGMSVCTFGNPMGGGKFNPINSLVFPVIMRGKMVGWQARLAYDPDDVPDELRGSYGFYFDDEANDYVAPPKCFTCPLMPKSSALMNFDVARESEVVVVVEGPISMAGVGPCAVSVLGKTISPEQVRLLSENWKLVILMLDVSVPTNVLNACALRLRSVVPTVIVQPTTAVVEYVVSGGKVALDTGDLATKAVWVDIYEQCQRHGVSLDSYDMGTRFLDYINRSDNARR